MKNLFKLFTVLVVLVYTSNTFAEELGIKMSNLNLNSFSSPAAKGKGKSSGSSGGIDKGLIQFDASFTLGGHSYVAPRTNYFGYGGIPIGVSPGVMFNVDVAVHPYASVGGYLGFDGWRGIFGIGIGARGVFHIYQLIADKAHTKVSPGDLDFYFPFHMGTIIGVGTRGGGASAGFAVGGGLGVRYYFNDIVGIMSEVGWLETSVWKLGVALKFK